MVQKANTIAYNLQSEEYFDTDIDENDSIMIDTNSVHESDKVDDKDRYFKMLTHNF